MPSILLSLLLALQLMLSGAAFQQTTQNVPAQATPQVSRLWWGMLDPELSAWFARIPMEAYEPERPILWNWSWRGFLAALFQQSTLKEAAADASSV